MAGQLYDGEFFEIVTSTASAAARRVVPHIVRWLGPSSVVDVGCGEGAWLAAFAAAGCSVVGVDGEHVDKERLLVPPEAFVVHDLEQPIRLAERFDLAVSLEVAEHLTPARAEGFVDDLVGLSSRVLFSAATPGQGGYGHVNEQPHTYWVRLFEDRGYATTTVLQRTFADDSDIAFWYRDNMMLFVEVARVS